MTRLTTTMAMVTKLWQLLFFKNDTRVSRRREDRAVSSAPVIEEDEASPVEWAPALPPRDRWPADLADLFANNPSGLQTWTEVETAMQRLVSYHAVRDTAHLYLPWRAARVAPAHAKSRARAHAGRCSPTLPRPASYAIIQVLTRHTGDSVVNGPVTGVGRPLRPGT